MMWLMVFNVESERLSMDDDEGNILERIDFKSVGSEVASS